MPPLTRQNPVRRNYIDGRWGQMHVRRGGEACGPHPALLMLHPTPKSGWIYEGIMSRLATGRLTLAPDTPGYGASDAAPAPPSIEDYAAAFLDLIDALIATGDLKDEPLDLMGYHTGSVIAVAMARLYPDRIRKLVLVLLAAYDTGTRARKLAGLSTWRKPDPDGGHLTAMWTLMRDLCREGVGADWLQASFTENLRSGPRAPWGYAAVYGYDLQQALSGLTHDALILNPEDDLYDITRAEASRAALATYIELPGMAHGLFDRHGAELAALIDAYLKST